VTSVAATTTFNASSGITTWTARDGHDETDRHA
jgi:hypothetical protein